MAGMIESGNVKLEVRHFPLQKPSLDAIKAVECAGDQGFWWAMHEQILVNQSKGVSASLMTQHANDLGLNVAAFNQCMTSQVTADKHIEHALTQADNGIRLGVQGTPTFLVNGKLLHLQSFDDVATAVKRELSKQ